MSTTARDVLQKLLRSPKPRKKSDLLNQQEYSLLASTSFDQFLAENFNEEQIGKLCAAEMEQLLFHYTELEKKSARTMKRVREKATKRASGTPRVVVRNVPAVSVSATSIVRSVPPVPANVPGAGADLVLENIENAIEESREEGEHVQRGDQVEELNVSLERIDLSRTMAPRELLLEEPTPVALPKEATEIDLGPPGDAGAFFGSTDPMPMDDPQVREQVLSEFPSLRRPQNDRGYEDLDEDLNARLMPPPPPIVPGTSGISSSTPITTDPQIRRRVLGAIDLSSIKYPTPAAVDALLRTDESSSQTPNVETVPTPQSVETAAPDISSIPEPEVSSEKEPSSNVDSGLPSEPQPEPEPMQIEPAPEPIPDIQPPPTPQERVPPVPAAVPSSSSSSSCEPPARTRGTVSRIRRVPEYNPSSLVVKFQTRTMFPLNDVDDDASMFDAACQLTEQLRQLRAARIAAAQRQVPQAADEQQPSLRDISSGAAYADISSIRELPSGSGAAQLQLSTSGALYPIPERPQVEEREELALRKSMPQRTPAIDSLELSANRVDLAVEPVIDVPNLEVPPQILITGTAEEYRGPTAAAAATTTTVPAIAENPVAEIALNLTVPEVPIPTRDDQRPVERPQPDPEPDTGGEKDDKKFSELLKLYLDINHAAKTARHGTISMEHLQVLECTPRNKMNCCKLFAKLLDLKRNGLIETGVDEWGLIRSVTVRG